MVCENEMKYKSQAFRDKSVKSEIDIIIASSQKLREESENTRELSLQIIDRSQKLREESENTRKESAQIIAG